MKKLRLDDLAVESFETSRVRGSSGTVRAHDDCEMSRCNCPTGGQCSNYCTQVEDYTCMVSCNCDTGGAENTCANTCYAGLTCPNGGCGGGGWGTAALNTCNVQCGFYEPE